MGEARDGAQSQTQTDSQILRLTDRVQDHEFRIATLAASVVAICDEVKGSRADVKELGGKIEAQVARMFEAIEKHAAACAAKLAAEENRKEIVVLKVFNGKILGMAAVISVIIGFAFQLLFWVITK